MGSSAVLEFLAASHSLLLLCVALLGWGVFMARTKSKWQRQALLAPPSTTSAAAAVPDQVYATAAAAADDPTLRAGTRVVTLGRLVTHDGGGWQYIVSQSQVPADGGIVIDCKSNGLQLRALHNGSATTLQYGCICDCKTDNAKQLQAAFNFPGDLTINGQNTYFTSKQLNADVPNRRITLVQGTTLAPAAPMEAVVAVNGTSGVTIEGAGTIDADHVAKAGVLLRCTGTDVAHGGSPMRGCSVRGITIVNTAVDPQLFCGGVQVDNKVGRGAANNTDGLIIADVTVRNCGTHGVLVAYAQNVTIEGCLFENNRNHGTEAVGCTWVQIRRNRAISCGISAFGVGSQTQFFDITDNMADGCAGDGAITVE